MCELFKKWVLPLTGFALVIGVWLHFGGYSKAMGDGQDKFDSLNSLFAGLAFVGMLCTLFMQRQELALQRDELKMTRHELHKTAEANQKSAEIARRNLRAQFLTFWLNTQLPDYQTALGEKSRLMHVKTELPSRIADLQRDIDKRKKQNTPHVGELAQLIKALDGLKARLEGIDDEISHPTAVITEYEENSKELVDLTKEMLF